MCPVLAFYPEFTSSTVHAIDIIIHWFCWRYLWSLLWRRCKIMQPKHGSCLSIVSGGLQTKTGIKKSGKPRLVSCSENIGYFFQFNLVCFKIVFSQPTMWSSLRKHDHFSTNKFNIFNTVHNNTHPTPSPPPTTTLSIILTFYFKLVIITGIQAYNMKW